MQVFRLPGRGSVALAPRWLCGAHLQCRQKKKKKKKQVSVRACESRYTQACWKQVSSCARDGEPRPPHKTPSRPSACHHLSPTALRTGTGFSETQLRDFETLSQQMGFWTQRSCPEQVGEPQPSRVCKVMFRQVGV